MVMEPSSYERASDPIPRSEVIFPEAVNIIVAYPHSLLNHKPDQREDNKFRYLASSIPDTFTIKCSLHTPRAEPNSVSVGTTGEVLLKRP
jgi:hypothetical protein